MQCNISQDLVLKILEWILFIALSIVSGWFSSGVLKQFYTHKTSFAQYEEKFTEYPVITILLHSQKVNLTDDVKFKYRIEGMSPQNLQIGENHFNHAEHNTTEKVIIQRIVRNNGTFFRLGFRIIHATPMFDDRATHTSAVSRILHIIGTVSRGHSGRKTNLFTKSPYLFVFQRSQVE